MSAAIGAGADYLGFVFYPRSPRHVSPQQAGALAEAARGKAKIVAVTVDASDESLNEIITHLRPDALQLHGAEQPARLMEIRARYPGITLIKAISVRERGDPDGAAAYADSADMLLFDAKGESLPGGMGVAFDWSLLAGRKFPLPWFLSGGLNAENAGEAQRITAAALLDVSSGIESAPGVKDAGRMQAFVAAARAAR